MQHKQNSLPGFLLWFTERDESSRRNAPVVKCCSRCLSSLRDSREVIYMGWFLQGISVYLLTPPTESIHYR